MQRFLKHLFRPAQIALAGKHQSPVQIGLWVLGRILNGLLKKCHRFGIPSQFGIERTQVTLGFGILWIDADSFLEGGLGLRDLFRLHVNGAQSVVSERQLGIQRNRLFEFTPGILWII